MCLMSHIMGHVSHVKCTLSHVDFFLQVVGPSWWMFCYQQGLTFLVFFRVIIILSNIGKNPTVHWSESGICSGLRPPAKKRSLQLMLSYQVNNKGIYWRCLKCNLTTALRFSTILTKPRINSSSLS